MLAANAPRLGVHIASPALPAAAREAPVMPPAGAVPLFKVAATAAPAPRPGAIPWPLLCAAPGVAPGRLREAAWVRRFDAEGAAPAWRCEADEAARIRHPARHAFYAR